MLALEAQPRILARRCGCSRVVYNAYHMKEVEPPKIVSMKLNVKGQTVGIWGVLLTEQSHPK